MQDPIDLEKFFADPSYQEERDFLRGVFDRFKTEDKEKAEQEAAQLKQQDHDAGGLGRVFDKIFSKGSK